MASHDITVVGSLSSDLVSVTDRMPAGGETLTSRSFDVLPGGKGANAAVAAARLSHKKPTAEQGEAAPALQDADVHVRMAGCVGDDAFGRPLIDALGSSSVDTSALQVVPDQPTGTAVIIVEAEKGENRILLSPGTNHFLQPKDVTDLSFSTDGSKRPRPDLVVVQLEIRTDTVLQVLQTAHEAGIETLLNPAPAIKLPEEIYKTVKHLILNETEAAILTGLREEQLNDERGWQEAVRWFIQRGVGNVTLTLGAKGAFYADQSGREGHVEAQKGVKVVDTTGAG